MTETSVHTELLHGITTGPRRFQAALVSLGGVLVAVLIGAAIWTPRSALIATNIGASAPQSVRVAAAAPAAVTQPSLAFGFLEFDWDPNAPGGVPGFDSWPKHDLRVAGVSPRH